MPVSAKIRRRSYIDHLKACHICLAATGQPAQTALASKCRTGRHLWTLWMGAKDRTQAEVQ
ncbi:hypothetical protein KW797_00145 [Candidatus Parcubacteria bacterium]|nr:hypothetical protein [Candidatus Parcubacteria bacterium]